MNKLLIICGPTATGKTAFGVELAKKYGGEIISADSRQVYTGMDIGTGKDLPVNSKFQTPNSKQIQNLKSENLSIGTYEISEVKIWGYDLVSPKDEFSVSHFLKFANIVIPDMWNRGVLPIIVGGTGFYLSALTNPPESVVIVPNQLLREELETLTLIDLQNKLNQINSEKFKSMNHSDQNNPRRLIRAIEIMLAPKSDQSKQSPLGCVDQLWIGLTASNEFIDQKIEARVNSRLSEGFEEEMKKLIEAGFNKDYPSSTATGYKQWLEYLSGNITKQMAINTWIRSEKQYARRQLTWFKNKPKINWFNVQFINWKHQVELHMKAWYPKNNN